MTRQASTSALHRFGSKLERAKQADILSILNHVCDYYEADRDGVMSRSRLPRFIWPRHVTMAIAMAHGFTTTSIADAFGRERTIVSYANKSVLDQCSAYPKLDKEIRALAKKIRENITKYEL